MHGIRFEIKEAIQIHEDNQGFISIANTPTCHKRSKHIDIKYHFLREQIATKSIIVEYFPTEYQLADIMTKPLAARRFLNLRNKMGLYIYNYGWRYYFYYFNILLCTIMKLVFTMV